jgi:hypothetical protein
MRILSATVATGMLLAIAAAAWATLHTASAQSHRQAAPPDHAVPGLVWRSGTATLRLTDGPCPVEDFVRALEREGVTPARAYVVRQGRQQFTGCWARDLDGDVLTMEADREPGTIPLSWFQAAAGSPGPEG